VRGFDVLDADKDNCGGPGVKTGCPVVGGTATDGEERDRPNDGRTEKFFWKLGDVFHSSPVLVKPPATEALCDTGYENQCLATLRSPGELDVKTVQTPIETYDDACHKGSDAYEAYRYDNRDRQRLVLVGANDGMLHAFDAGKPKTGSIADSDCVKPYGPGSGGEVWAYLNANNPQFFSLSVVEKSAMNQEVQADAAAFAEGLAATGHAAVYGIYFDTNKSEVKPESAGALGEVAKLLSKQPALKLLVVGHTDSVGALEANLKLSSARAEAVVKALTTTHGVAPARLKPQGAGPIAPVASNRTEEGRAKNRRVELVEQ